MQPSIIGYCNALRGRPGERLGFYISSGGAKPFRACGDRGRDGSKAEPSPLIRRVGGSKACTEDAKPALRPTFADGLSKVSDMFAPR